MVLLRPASLDDRRRVYEWLAVSDATPLMMGPPQFPDHPIPTWQEFCADYADRFYCPEGDSFGRLFVIGAEQREIGCISYDGLDNWRGIAELDIWIGSSADWGHGWGSQAIRELSSRLLHHPTVEYLIMRPSCRNVRAIAAYQKAGFVFYDPALHQLPKSVVSTGLDYADAVVLVQTRAQFGRNDSEIHLDLSRVTSDREIHELFARSLSFPSFYGHNWDAFWDVLVGFDCFPRRLILSGKEHLQQAVPQALQHLESCFTDCVREYPDTAPTVIWR